jgi:polysaccharide export outer membrane protein
MVNDQAAPVAMPRKSIMRYLGLCAAVLLGGCATLGRPSVDNPALGIQVMEIATLPSPGGADPAAASGRAYHLGPFDTLVVDVFGVEALSHKEIQADANGRIAFPLIGDIDAAGKSLGEVGAIIQERLGADFVRNPQVTVNLKETVSQVVTIDGEVNQPGLYPVIGRMTLTKAVAVAQGSMHPSRFSRVMILRTVNDQKMAAVYNPVAIYRGYYADPEIFPDDVVVVGNGRTRRILKVLPTASSLLKAPLVISFQKK